MVVAACIFAVGAAAAEPTIEIVHGRCVRCTLRFELGKLQFLDVREGWAVGFVSVVFNGHMSQSSGVLHTTDGGATWRRVKFIESYGAGVEPAFWFVDRRHGWIGWPTAAEPLDHLMQTDDGGRTWRDLPAASLRARFISGFSIRALAWRRNRR